MPNQPNNWMSERGFHLSVNVDGLVSLWDTRELAQDVQGETYVFLPLSSAQQLLLEEAAVAAAGEQNA